MKKFMITFRMVDPSDERIMKSALYSLSKTPTEYMMIESPCNMTATMEFCNLMEGELFVIDDVKEIENEMSIL